MSATPLLPQAFWFRLSVPCRRVDGLPLKGGKALLNLPEVCRLPETSRLDGNPPWADVRVAWCPAGLGISAEAEGPPEALTDDDRPEAPYGLRVWVDTRDTRDVSRATRFCHRFDVRLARGSGRSSLGVIVQQKPIARAIADAPTCRPDAWSCRAERTRKGWKVELFLSADALHGFDPETNRRLGLTYQAQAPDREDQFLGVGREFPVGENPSLWSTLELRDDR